MYISENYVHLSPLNGAGYFHDLLLFLCLKTEEKDSSTKHNKKV